MDKKHRILYKLAMVVLITVMAFTMTIQPVSAKSKPKVKKSTVYEQVYKSGNDVYCIAGKMLAKVNLKTGKVKIIDKYGISCFMKKGKYLYAMTLSDYDPKLFRISTKNWKKKTLTHWIASFAVSKKKVYYTYENYYKMGKAGKPKHKVMKLNGKAKKKSKVKVKMKHKKTNAKGYYTYYVDTKMTMDHDYYKAYLVTPKKTYYIGTGDWEVGY